MLRMGRGNFAPGQYEQMMMQRGQQPNGMPMTANDLRKNAIQNTRNTQVSATQSMVSL